MNIPTLSSRLGLAPKNSRLMADLCAVPQIGADSLLGVLALVIWQHCTNQLCNDGCSVVMEFLGSGLGLLWSG